MKKRKSRLILWMSVLCLFLFTDPAQAVDVEDYNYEVFPILEPFNSYFYVKTDNPDPESFRLVDQDSKYIFEQEDTTENLKDAIYKIDRQIYKDVEYEDAESYRVQGGYIFKKQHGCEGKTDGGELIVQRRTSPFGPDQLGEPVESGSWSSFDPQTVGSWEDTSKRVQLPKLVDYADYLMEEKTDPSKTLFENLDEVQRFLEEFSVYPHTHVDSSEKVGYPFLAASPYPELSLNRHVEEVYKYEKNASLLYRIYPYVLDSASTPWVMRYVAENLDPDAKVESGDVHYLIKVTKGEESRYYGGAGEGGRAPVPIQILKTYYRFDGSQEDFYQSQDLSLLYETLMGLKAQADNLNKDLLSQISGEAFAKKIGPGSWIQVAVEGYSRLGKSVSYMAAGPVEGTTWVASKAWVDGRYINEHELLEIGQSFEDHPKADIILRNQTYTRRDGSTRTSDLIYQYDQDRDAWIAPFYYEGSYSYPSNIELPDQFVLTKEEVASLQVDRNKQILPVKGLIYDGSVEPGTPYQYKNVASLSLPETIRGYEGKDLKVTVQLTPSENLMSDLVLWELEGHDITKYGGWDLEGYTSDHEITLKDLPAGNYVLKVTSSDGAKTAKTNLIIKKLTKKTETVLEEIPYETYEEEDPQLMEGERRVAFPGINGTAEVTYQVAYEGETEIWRKEVSREVKEYPQTEQIFIGTKRVEKQTKAVPFETIYIEDPTLAEDEQVVEQEGVDGEEELTYEVGYWRGKEVQRELVSTRRTKEPIPKKVRVYAKLGWIQKDGVWKFRKEDKSFAQSEWIWTPVLDSQGLETDQYNWKFFNYKGESMNQFYEENGKVWLSQEGPTTDYHKGWWTNPENGFKYFFRLESGSRVSGRQYVDGGWIFFRDSGTQAFGWQFYGGNWRYNDPTRGGKEATSQWLWLPVQGKQGVYNWKFFNYKGESMNQFYEERGRVWLSQRGPNTDYYKGWWTNPENGFVYYFRETSGSRVSGLQFIDGYWRFFRDSGTMAYGAQKVQGVWMYFDDQGRRVH